MIGNNPTQAKVNESQGHIDTYTLIDIYLTHQLPTSNKIAVLYRNL